MKKILILIFFNLTLFGTSILDEYRLHGIDGIEKKLDFALSKQSYWDKHLADINTTFGYIQKHSLLLVCDKDTNKLRFYKKDNTDFKLEQIYDVYTGKEKGDKLQEGDYRTPDGIYELTNKIEKLDAFYGPLAFVTSYPNVYDRYNGKDGHGIWIHGLPLNQDRDTWTKGCIAVDNDDLKTLDENIELQDTLLIINEQEPAKKINKTTIAQLLSQLYLWRYHWIYNNLDEYLSFYDDSFSSPRHKTKEHFSRYKQRVFAKKEKKKILFTNIDIIPYPNKENIYKITLDEFYKSNSLTFRGSKTLFVKLQKSGKMKIFIEN